LFSHLLSNNLKVKLNLTVVLYLYEIPSVVVRLQVEVVFEQSFEQDIKTGETGSNRRNEEGNEFSGF
jgi:hypothetical protein